MLGILSVQKISRKLFREIFCTDEQGHEEGGWRRGGLFYGRRDAFVDEFGK